MSKFITRDMCVALSRGDHVTFDKIFIRYIRSVTMFIKGLIDSESDAEELAHDVFLGLWENRQNLKADSNITGYLYISAKNAAFRYIRKKNSEKEYVRHELFVRDAAGNLVEDEYEARELEMAIEVAISKLSPQQRTIYRMSREEGLTNDEIAQRLGISKRTVENHITAALSTLRRILPIILLLIAQNR